MRLSSSLPQWFCGDMPAMDGQWWSSRIVSVRTNRVLKKSAPVIVRTNRVLLSPQSYCGDEEDGALDCLHDVTVYLYYAFCFMLIEHSVCHEPISVLINVFVLLA